MTEVRHWTEVADDPRLVVVGGRESLGKPGRCQAASFGQGAYALDYMVNYDGRTPPGVNVWREGIGDYVYGSVTGKFWRRCGNPSSRGGDFCSLHAGMMGGFTLTDPGRKKIAGWRSRRAKLNADRRDPGTPAYFYWRERSPRRS